MNAPKNPSEPQAGEPCRLLIVRRNADDTFLKDEDRDKLIYKARGLLEVVFFGTTIMRTAKLNEDTGHVDVEEVEIDGERLIKEAREADIALLVFEGRDLSLPKRRQTFQPVTFQPYVAGFAKGVGTHTSVVCVHAQNVEENLINLLAQSSDEEGSYDKTIPAKREDLRKLLVDLYTKKDFTNTYEPLNEFIDRADSEFLDHIAAELEKAIIGDVGEIPTVSYGNPTLCFNFPPGCSKLLPEIEVNSNGGEFNQLFNLARNVNQIKWLNIDRALKKLEKIYPGGEFHKWARELEDAIPVIREQHEPNQIRNRMIAVDQQVYRPEIERYEVFKNGLIKVDVSFSAQIQDKWLVNASSEAAVAYNLMIAARIRHDIVGRYEEKISHMSERDWSDLKQSVGVLLTDGWFLMAMAKERIEKVLGIAKMKKIAKYFEEKVFYDLTEGIKDKNRDQVDSALQKWSKNNHDFFHLALNWYQEQVENDTEGR